MMRLLIICLQVRGFVPQGRQFTLTPMVYPTKIEAAGIFAIAVGPLFKRLIRNYLTLQAVQPGG
jgi:hypothetical protein